MISDEEQVSLLSTSKFCVICKKHLHIDKVVRHDHSTGKTFELAYNECNLKQRTQSFTPVLFHNLSKYDSHHLIRYLSLLPDEELTVVPCTDEKYIFFSLHVSVGKFDDKKGSERIKFEEMRFLDNFRFLPDSLDKLSKSLHSDDFIIMKHFFSRRQEKNASDAKRSLSV